ncbi:MAG: sulfotransferase [Sandaracinaceae bacterium]|nr:sulfotransferase [Myxococcales bacterium]MCB9658716.1 sulfotransferase [Sandaracinaceae bacterium]
MQDQLIFLLSAPRSGSTLLQRMIGGHSQIYTHPEPHLISPLAHLGFYDNIDKAPFDHINAAEALKSFVAELPRGEDDYLDALRAYTDIMYGRMLAPTGQSRFLDKTPANSLVWPFLTKLYPRAKYLVLTRHPLAVFSSFANSFFDGDWQAAYEFNPIVERYVGALGHMLRERPVPLFHARYEDLVKQPALSLERMFAYCGLPHEEGAEEYGKGPEMKKGMGDPIGVGQHDRAVTSSIGKWTQELRGDAKKLELARRMLDRCDPADLAEWGFDEASLWAPYEQETGTQAPKRTLNSYTFQRRVMLALKKDIDTRPHGKLVRRVKYYCDVLLRE